MLRGCEFNQTEGANDNFCVIWEINLYSRTDIDDDVGVEDIFGITGWLVNSIGSGANTLL
jgi:hypothetical protein